MLKWSRAVLGGWGVVWKWSTAGGGVGWKGGRGDASRVLRTGVRAGRLITAGEVRRHQLFRHSSSLVCLCHPGHWESQGSLHLALIALHRLDKRRNEKKSRCVRRLLSVPDPSCRHVVPPMLNFF